MNKIEITKRKLNGITVLEYNPIGVEKERLVFYVHGFTMNKEDGSTTGAYHFASRGFKVVIMDAFGHGERMTKKLQYSDYKKEMEYFYEIIENTAEEIKKMYEDYYKEDFPQFNIVGESMGGMLTYMVGCITEGLSGIGAIVGSPSLLQYGYDDMEYNKCKKDEYMGMLDHLSKYDAMEHLELFVDIKIYMLCGTKDDVVPKKYSEKFIKIMKEKYGKDDIIYHEVDSGHWIAHKDCYGLYEWAKKEFR